MTTVSIIDCPAVTMSAVARGIDKAQSTEYAEAASSWVRDACLPQTQACSSTLPRHATADAVLWALLHTSSTQRHLWIWRFAHELGDDDFTNVAASAPTCSTATCASASSAFDCSDASADPLLPTATPPDSTLSCAMAFWAGRRAFSSKEMKACEHQGAAFVLVRVIASSNHSLKQTARFAHR